MKLGEAYPQHISGHRVNHDYRGTKPYVPYALNNVVRRQHVRPTSELKPLED